MSAQQERTADSVRWSEASLHALIENAPFGVYVVDSDFRIAHINAEAQERAFRNVRPAMGRDFAEAIRVLWPEEVAAPIVDQFRHTLTTGEAYYSRDYVEPRADIDAVEAYEWELHRMVLPDGRAGVVCYYFDSSKLRGAEQALRRSEALVHGQKEALQASACGATLEASLELLVRSAVEHAGHGARAAFYLVNEAGTAISHVTGMGEAYARALGDFVVGPDSICCGLTAYTGVPKIYPDVLLDSTWAPFLSLARDFDYRACWSFPVAGLDGKIVGSFCVYSRVPRDPTAHDREVAIALTHAAAVIIARHKANEERARAVEALRDADRRKDEFLAMLAHELRNPLAAIRNAGQILLRSEGEGGATHRSAAEILNRQVDHMVRQVDDLLDVSRISRGKIELRKEITDVAAVVRDAVEGSRPQVESAGHTLTVELPAEAIHVEGDAVRLAQVVGNLLTNACKFTSDGGRIELAVERDGDEVVIRIRDTGVGIAAAELPRIFEIFAQVDGTLERTRRGLGLGLTLVKNLVEMHGGTVEARSEGLGCGSEFRVRLPVRRGVPVPVPVARESSAAAVSSSVPLRVLVVDDDRDAAESLAMLLKMMGHEVDTAHDGLEAIERASTFGANLILLDIGMPGLNGYEAARRIRSQQQKGLKIVALTGWAQEEDRRLSEEAGFDAHFVKPVDVAVLRRLLADAG